MLTALLVSTATLKVAFSDEFNTPGRPDPTKWNYEIGFVRNKELQYYQPQNAWVEGGHLIIEGRQERVKNPNFKAGSDDWKTNREHAEYSSASVITRERFSWKFGRLEVRARFRPEKGLWPAIWTKGVEKPWPQCGEIDLMEFYQDHLHANTAYGAIENQKWDSVRTPMKHFYERSPKWASEFHTWAMDWTPDYIRLSVDGELLNETVITEVKNPDGFQPFHQPIWLLMNLAIGSTGGDPTKTKFPARYEIDYVRIFTP